MDEIMSGQAPPALVAGFLVALRMKAETAEEITGCAKAIIARALPVRHTHERLVDTCGTGGDGAGTFNISTTAAFIVAGSGVPVAKHGNRALSSRAGSADVLEALGLVVDLAGPDTAEALEKVGIAFLFAPAFHSAMRHAAPVRKELAIRTVFNVLGPLCNPAGATAQIVGVFDARLTPVLAQVLRNLGARRALVVHGSDGLDELTLTGPSLVAEWDGESVRQYTLDPCSLGLPLRSPEELKGGDPAHNARILRSVLEGEAGAARDIALLNAAGALIAAGEVECFEDGLVLARQSIDSGKALAKLEALINYSQRARDRRQARIEQDNVAAALPGWGR